MDSCPIQLKLDNTTAVTHINRGGGGVPTPSCNFFTHLIWHRNIWLSAAYIPGEDNVVADFCSCFFRNICNIYFTPQIDLFVSFHNEGCHTWYPIQKSGLLMASLFLCLVARMLGRMNREEARGILVVQKWTTQSWFPMLLTIIADHPREIRPHKLLVSLPLTPNSFHPLCKKLVLLAVHLSGKHWSEHISTSYCICHSWRPSTRDQCNSIMQWWGGFCTWRQMHPSSHYSK